MKLLFLTGSRGEWGYIRPILRLCRGRTDIEYSICATNMHLLPSYGLSIEEIKADGFNVDDTIYMSLNGDNYYSMVKSLGVFLCSFSDILASKKPDWIILAGDRGEQLMGAIAGAHCYIPVAHVQAGEVSGNIDNSTRHAIGKYAHLHFASNRDAANRLERLGEELFRIKLVGAPQIDELVNGMFTDKEELSEKYSIDFNQKHILMVQHPITEEYAESAEQVGTTIEALNQFDMPKIVIFPNNDAGSLMIKNGIENSRRGRYHLFSNLKRADYLGIMKNSVCIVGNSSSGILEAPTFKVTAVNLGRRQQNRIQGQNVINAPFEKRAIVAAIRKAMSNDFLSMLQKNCENPYGDGTASKKILECLIETPITDQLLIKQLTY